MTPTLVLNVVGLSEELLGSHTPHLLRLAKTSTLRPIAAVTPAVTCTAQATYLTGKPPSEHGIVANGWYFRDLAEVWLWRQSNRLVQTPKVWDVARKLNPEFTVANLFWWYNMYSSVDWSVTPRPMYPADGRKLPDVYTQPPDLRDTLNRRLGAFPLFQFWGPKADLPSSRWITDAALHVMREKKPTLTLVYLPHLDYNLQRLGPDLQHPQLRADLRAVDGLCGELLDAAKALDMRVLVVSEYGITKTRDAVHINRALRRAGLLEVRHELGRELLDAGASRAFAVSDHQLAHVYVARPEDVPLVAEVLRHEEGIERVLDAEGKRQSGLDHERSGELVAISKADRWFSYYYWLDDDQAPDFATTVDIHRKPGYDPVELFFDPKLRIPTLAAAFRLLKRKLGFRTLMDVISPSATSLIRGSHGRPTDDPKQGPLVMAPPVCDSLCPPGERVAATAVFDLMLKCVFD
jgi:predicted AlkP superfamily pyrophosphatase or phosphodiesterase